MKGTFFVKPFELKADVSGEKWGQGDSVKGVLTVTNRHHESASLKDLGVVLANADAKKLAVKDPRAFDPFEKIFFCESDTLPPGESKELHWSFPLSSDFPLTQKSSTPCLVFGKIDQLEAGGVLQMQVGPIEIINKYIELFENFLRFKNKGMKSKKGHIEFKLQPPGSKEFSFIESLTLLVRLDENDLDVNYHFIVSKMAFDAPGLGVSTKKEEIKINQRLAKNEYLIYGNAINQDVVLQRIKEVMVRAKGGGLFK